MVSIPEKIKEKIEDEKGIPNQDIIKEKKEDLDLLISGDASKMSGKEEKENKYIREVYNRFYGEYIRRSI